MPGLGQQKAELGHRPDRRTMKAFVSVLLLVACSFAASQPNNESGLSIVITAPSELKSGSELDLRIQLTNTSDHDINLLDFYTDGVNNSYEYQVRDATGRVKKHKDTKAHGSFRTLTLKPGETTEQGTLISRAFDLEEPGQYSIRLSRSTGQPSAQSRATSNQITVTVSH